MEKICVHLPATLSSSYEIKIQEGLLQHPQDWLPKGTYSIVIITDDWVKKNYGILLVNRLKKEGYHPFLLSFRSGEKFKTIRTKCALEKKMLAKACDRNTLILALGGGVVGDLAGFIAATYMRGVSYIQIPSTLLAMVDSSVGGKTGVDTPYGKNLIGSFWQPKAVIADINCLQTLPKNHLINGLIEAFKMFLTSDGESLIFLQNHLDTILNHDKKALTKLVERAVKIKATVVKNDEKEANQRAILNFGHTIGHALEHISNYQILHGVAVGYGLLVEAKIAELLGILPSQHYSFIKKILARLTIHAQELKNFDLNDLIKSTKLDKKKRGNDVNYVLLNNLGSVHATPQFVHPVADELVREAFFAVVKE